MSDDTKQKKSSPVFINTGIKVGNQPRSDGSFDNREAANINIGTNIKVGRDSHAYSKTGLVATNTSIKVGSLERGCRLAGTELVSTNLYEQRQEIFGPPIVVTSYGPMCHPSFKKYDNRIIDGIYSNKIVFVGNWGVNCGIAIYTKDLIDELDKYITSQVRSRTSQTATIADEVGRGIDLFVVKGVNDAHNIGANIIHLQHEYGIMPYPPMVSGKVIISWHTIRQDMSSIVRDFESKIDIVAHIIPCELARGTLSAATNVPIYVIPLGSKHIERASKEYARKRLKDLIGLDLEGLKNEGNKNKAVVFNFGFFSGSKQYQRMIDAAKNTNAILIISGAPHYSGSPSIVIQGENVIFLNRFLSEEEIDLFALASDILLFDYVRQNHYSSSAALHRVCYAGRPIITSRVEHFSDISENQECLKFSDQSELEQHIRNLLGNPTEYERLSEAAREFGIRTSWENVVNMHMDIYKKFLDIDKIIDKKLNLRLVTREKLKGIIET